MGFLLVNTATGVSGTGTSLAITVPSTTAGNLLAVPFKFNSSVATVVSVTDNKGNTYTVRQTETSTAVTSGVAEGIQTTGGATSVTVTISASNPIRITAMEFSGEATSSWYDTGGVGNDTSPGPANSTSFATNAFSPSAAGDLIVVALATQQGGTFTAGSGYTLGGSSGAFLVTQYRLSGTTSETAPITSNTSSVAWAEAAAAYQPAGGGGGGTTVKSFSFSPAGWSWAA